MTDAHRVPVIIGVADLRNGGAGLAVEPVEPLELVVEAATAALADTGVTGVGSQVDAIYAVRTASWAYADLPGLVAERVGAGARRTWTSPIGGHWPAALLDRIGSEVAEGSTTTALLVGGEAPASVRALAKAGTDPVAQGWRQAPGGLPDFSPDDLGSAEMQRAGAVTPTRVYPLFEHRLGHDLGQSPRESRAASARLYAGFSHLAAAHPVAWIPTVRTIDDLATASPTNRPVSDAYPLAMNAMPFVDQAAAIVVCSLARARELGVDPGRVVHLWGGAGASDSADVLARSDFGASPALESALARTLAAAGVTGADLALVDAYSCFPVVPKLLVRALGLPEETVPSVLGGHSFFGGPLNSYTLHAIAEVVRRLRAGADDDVALVHGNGGYLTHQHTVLLSRTAHAHGYVGDPVPQLLARPAPPVVRRHDGPAEIVTAAVDFGRDGQPSSALVVAATPEGHRVAGTTDAADAAALLAHTRDGTRSLVGTTVHVTDREDRFAVAPVGP